MNNNVASSQNSGKSSLDNLVHIASNIRNSADPGQDRAGTSNDTTQGIAGVGVAKTTSNVDLPQHSTKAVEGAYTQQNSTKNTQFTPYRISSHNSSETSQSIPNTPSITRQVESNTRSQIPLAQQEKKVELLDSSLIYNKETLFGVFERYHPILPVVDVSLGPERIYRLCPAYFGYESVITFTATASILKHDMAYRSSGITRNMWQLFRELDAKKMNSLSIDIRNRMSASVFFDCLKLLRAQVGITKLTTKTDESHPADDDEAIEESQEEVEDEDDQQLAEMGNEKAAPSEDEKNGSLHNVSQKSTPNSTTSSRVRRARTLSNNMDAESKTRKIIRTIPLDPEPISIGASKRSSIFKVVNSSTDSSPIMKSDTRTQTYNPSHVGKQYSQQSPHISSKQTVQSSQYQHHQQLQQPQQLQQHQYEQILQSDNRSYQPAQNISEAPLSQFSAFAFNESPIQLGLENLDIDNFDHDMLWKDVDSVMNDFGFHTS
ncbi:hypothetical protein FOB64_006709 [Candida albicans]|uniref:Uncharacterized protein n=1 Tax=Candida albicans TaxID=5476 RepID=A0A8H6BT32_CANAX|nr:hypothetical protein FOB64_006709 [Candida albicans]